MNGEPKPRERRDWNNEMAMEEKMKKKMLNELKNVLSLEIERDCRWIETWWKILAQNQMKLFSLDTANCMLNEAINFISALVYYPVYKIIIVDGFWSTTSTKQVIRWVRMRFGQVELNGFDVILGSCNCLNTRSLI